MLLFTLLHRQTVHGSHSARLLNVLALLGMASEDFTSVIRNSVTISTVLVQCETCLRMLQPLRPPTVCRIAVDL